MSVNLGYRKLVHWTTFRWLTQWVTLLFRKNFSPSRPCICRSAFCSQPQIDKSTLYQLLPPQSAASQNYNLRRRTHDRQLHEHQGHLSDCNFITRLVGYCTKIHTDSITYMWIANCSFFIVQTISFIYACIVISSAVCQMS